MGHITVDLVDTDEALEDARRSGSSVTRAGFFKRAAFGAAAGGLVITGLPSVAHGQRSAAQDVEILNFALLLEYLEAEFYADALRRGALSGETLQFARVVGGHEAAHVEFLQGALGSSAIAKPTFDFKGTTADAATFRATAVVLEDTGVAAYNGQGPRLRKQTLAAAASIVSVEARHAAWIRRIVSGPAFSAGRASFPAPVAFDAAQTKAQIEQAVGATGFITGS